jgi:hypothetical protein
MADFFEHLRKENGHLFDSDEQLWTSIKERFMTYDPYQRQECINKFSEDISTVTKDSAGSLNRKRELEDLHMRMYRAGR